EPASGLYTMRGLERRAREVVSDAFRRHAPVACVALAVELESQDGHLTPLAAPPVAVAYAGEILQARGRASDAIGRLGHSRRRGADGPTADPGARNGGPEARRAAALAGPGGLRGRRRPARDAAR